MDRVSQRAYNSRLELSGPVLLIQPVKQLLTSVLPSPKIRGVLKEFLVVHVQDSSDLFTACVFFSTRTLRPVRRWLPKKTQVYR